MTILTLGRRHNKGSPSGELLLTTLAARGTPANTTETDLANIWLGPSLIGVGDGLRLTLWARTAANANTKRLRIYLGTTTLLDTTALAANNEAWNFELFLSRQGAAAQSYLTRGFRGATVVAAVEAAATENMDLPRNLRITGQNGTGTANDLSLRGLWVERVG